MWKLEIKTLTEDDNRERFLQEVSLCWSFSLTLPSHLLFHFANIGRLIRSCAFHPNIMKIVGYCLEPDFYMISKLYEIDLFNLVHNNEENISSLLGLKLIGFNSSDSSNFPAFESSLNSPPLLPSSREMTEMWRVQWHSFKTWVLSTVTLKAQTFFLKLSPIKKNRS